MMGESISEHTSDAGGAPHSRVNTAQERLSDLDENARTKVVAAAKCTDTAIRENPYQAVAITAGVGVLVGRQSK